MVIGSNPGFDNMREELITSPDMALTFEWTTETLVSHQLYNHFVLMDNRMSLYISVLSYQYNKKNTPKRHTWAC